MPVGYGKKLRVKEAEVRKKSKRLYKCPGCSRVKVRRRANGVWECMKCGKKYASGAFEFKV